MAHQQLAVAFTGPSNSGKTTLIRRIAQKLIHEEGKEVAIIKNDPKDKAQFDVPGKDSFLFYQTGAQVAVVSPTRTTLFSNRQQSLDEVIAHFGAFDLVLVEGLRTLPLPRIGIFRDRLDASYFEHLDAIAIDDTIDISTYSIPETIDVLDLNDPAQVIDWIYTHAKEI